jgi:hypothetical protein
MQLSQQCSFVRDYAERRLNSDQRHRYAILRVSCCTDHSMPSLYILYKSSITYTPKAIYISSIYLVKRPAVIETAIPDFIDDFAGMLLVFYAWPCHHRKCRAPPDARLQLLSDRPLVSCKKLAGESAFARESRRTNLSQCQLCTLHHSKASIARTKLTSKHAWCFKLSASTFHFK